ncbi:hypothetical protein SporoP37_11100 [Sporosarcina sp. P37]|uniref:GntR family transcriptional regulator n=1 Tax=unclassified Sporosarcina TaxID=2647733 RepID=UPI000A17DD24|nr:MULTISPECIES: GntR family transcriptional regulator [unclassified Sporosarcina]ARK25146.1 hypothetical protein SporoP37_11100 [Sporosarcina sp. P37]PID15792.1 GntR family transcriptional regulator [Sporosarcina sp. P35]
MTIISKPKYLNDKAYAQIKELIIKGELKGPMVSENELADLLGMSRTPIREALLKLASENFVEIYPRKGIYIKQMTVAETNNVMDVRLAIELFSIEKLSAVFADEHLERLEALVEEQQKMYEESKVYEFIKSDLEYHSYLLQLTGNDYFVKILGNVSDRCFHHGMKIFQDLSRIQMSIDDHILINENLKKRDFDMVRSVMEQHILKGKQHFLS